MYICRQLTCGVESLEFFYIAFDNETAVELYKVGNPVVNQQIVADRHLREGHFGPDKAKIQKGGVENYVAMVRQECETFVRADIFKTGRAETVCGLSYKHFKKVAHYPVLEITLVLYRKQFIDKCLIVDIGHYIPDGMLEAGLFYQRAQLVMKA